MSFFKSLQDNVDQISKKVSQLSVDKLVPGNSTPPQPVTQETQPVNGSSTVKPSYYGPYLRCAGTSPDAKTWYGSILVVSESQISVTISCPPVQVQGQLSPEVLAQHKQYKFYRFALSLPVHAQNALQYQYTVQDGHGESKTFTFHVASSEATWKMAFYSCNGLSSDVPDQEKQAMGGIQPLWKDLMQQHAQSPFHLMIGGGDQVYADPMWTTVPSLMNWLEIKGKENRKTFAWNDVLESEVSLFYFDLYTQHFNEAIFKDAMASIPTISTMDDHDAWDGYGSYPEVLQESQVFQNCGRLAFHFYLLFQHHTTAERAHKDGLLGKNNQHYNVVAPYGREVAIVMLDTRSERTLSQVVSRDTYGIVFEQIKQLPSTVRHLIFVTGVPLAYPRLEAADKAMNMFGQAKETANQAANSMANLFSKIPGASKIVQGNLGSVKKGLGKSGLMHSMINLFGLPELADDLNDHWTSELHSQERQLLVESLQQLSESKKMRVTFIAGDVHCAAVGRFVNAQDSNILDHRYMVQITSSAIGNVPPPAMVIQQLNLSGKRTFALNPTTKEEMMTVFDKDVDGASLQAKCIGRRNYCIIESNPQHGLTFKIMVEKPQSGSVGYPVEVPCLS